ncbi:carbon-nitrogen hydrolase family protein [Rhodoferax sp.]|uniref:carbon-nitrogen hydrolase family protein n=1 Tax=Rhodoferax sp. TaxID=50421 RepID=UPI0008AD1D0F|nr:carbon-nitrogen hydrolase family protein [Rhodoferax sp.]MDO8320933.1 carbon-nitrogen hydrolase family protein [Rhodoferax sp.]MDP2677772.1 carbon-nitrogen hydrolase family protein [Rhodoferax sp.]OGB52614.1 MAG: acyltransferase [Burkholderiales bacterium RIFOXYD12_FULL_59_19]OGB81605.1 MAG: acyltransferase [Burkholderiales bacterium RIFOXYC12_FULL_60_6]
MKVAAIQMASGADLSANLAEAKALLQMAAQAGAELAVLPEYFCLMGQRDADKLAIQEPFGQGPIQQFLSDSARELGLWLVGGTLPVSAPPELPATTAPPGPRVFNSSLVYAPSGACLARYDKMHLFRFDNGVERYDESLVLAAGQHPTTFDLASADGHTWRIGLSVCYDLRFPELYRHYAQAGAHLMLVPAAFTYTTGQDHWELLLRARAIENLSFVVAAAQGGLHDNLRRTWGHAMLVDPWGKVLAEQAQGPGVVTTELSWDLMQQCRSRLPALEHRLL